ncbi:MAG TPA: cysteine desulfurase family protein [Candidatus Pacearchaeota archaeon]|nr:cysteine desulfurase family protein [Candidatus Pacearchaeota archaeon]HOR52610.1 cysteine desulfurase family protein [Candidatus Pacearchaeota archaeon]HPJ87032.1 cysteine desulfurase family protein [Candidatus Pacearchaeota archaeon]HQF83043.1 cysteine desulfurase family protein [Candidatus Pacearchaeota archaeon]HQJ58052.1 cysteine desulfurase family protein [Candidatus Pacearchaeota archaeon]
MRKRVYFDNASTTKVDEKVVREMLPYFSEIFGNASSQHDIGIKAKDVLERSRRIIAKSIKANIGEIIFTSGGTEANNFALKGLFFSNYPQKNHIITTKIEHDSILNVCRWLETQGAKITYLDVDEEGFVDIEDIRKSITDKTFLVSIIHGNNEIGTIQDIEAIGKLCREKKVLFHTDACQSFTKVPINVGKQNLDLVTLNAHKIYGPKGVGALYIRDGIQITPFAHGGGHEKKLRSGTENIPGIVGFAKSVDISNEKDVRRMTTLRDKLIEGLLKIENVKLNGPVGDKRLCNNINVSFNNIEGEAIGGYLENERIYTSTGSACMSNTLQTSHVLKALGLSPLQSNSSLRISISKYTTEDDINYFLEKITKIVKKLRIISPLTK